MLHNGKLPPSINYTINSLIVKLVRKTIQSYVNCVQRQNRTQYMFMLMVVTKLLLLLLI